MFYIIIGKSFYKLDFENKTVLKAFYIDVEDAHKIRTFSIIDKYGRYMHLATHKHNYILDILKEKP